MGVRRAAKYRERIEVQERRPTQNAHGDTVEAWVTVAGGKRRAEITATGGSQPIQGNQQQAITVYLVVTRADRLMRSVKPTQRLLWISAGGRVLNIESAVPVGDGRREIKFACVELVI